MNRSKHILLSTGLLLGVMFTCPVMNNITAIAAETYSDNWTNDKEDFSGTWHYYMNDGSLFFASTFSSKMQIDFLKVAWGISPVLHFPLRHSFRCRRGAVAGIQSLLVTDM